MTSVVYDRVPYPIGYNEQTQQFKTTVQARVYRVECDKYAFCSVVEMWRGHRGARKQFLREIRRDGLVSPGTTLVFPRGRHKIKLK